MTDKYCVIALYKFVTLDDLDSLQAAIKSRCGYADLRGTILLAREGINGTIAGETQAMQTFLDWLTSDPRFADLETKRSWASSQPFLRMKVRLKAEIVAMGVTDLSPDDGVGTYVEAEDWNELIADPDVILVDTRNDYEVAIGTFEGAINPGTERFRDMPQWMEENIDPATKPKLAMFCTGGIRCEKSTAYARKMGVDDVYHLKGGILKYLERVEQTDSKWQGECFVFDQRVSVTHGLSEGTYALCHACRQPLAAADLDSDLFVEGVQCPHCAADKSADQQRRYKERQRQINLAKKRGERHLGS